MQELHRQLDQNKDGYIDFGDWINVLKEDTNIYLLRIKDIIQNNNIKADDLIKKMQLKKS